MSNPSPGQDIAGNRVPASIYKRNLWLGVVALAVAAFWIVVIPALNRSLDYDDPIKEGQSLLVAPGITFEPPDGWNLEAGIRTSDHPRTNVPGAPATIALGPVKATVNSSPADSDETPQHLIEEIEQTSVQFDNQTLAATGQKVSVPVTGWKQPGLAEHYAAPNAEGVVAAFVIDGTAVVVKVVGPAAEMNEQGDAIGEMLASFTYDASEAAKVKAGK